MRIEVSARDCTLPPGFSDTLQRQLQLALGRFGSQVGCVHVRMSKPPNRAAEDSDHHCQIQLVVQPIGAVDAEALDADGLRAAVRAIERIERRIRLELSFHKEGIFPGIVG